MRNMEVNNLSALKQPASNQHGQVAVKNRRSDTHINMDNNKKLIAGNTVNQLSFVCMKNLKRSLQLSLQFFFFFAAAAANVS